MIKKYAEYKALLAVSKNFLDDALEEQASSMQDINERIVELKTGLLKAENKLKTTDAELFEQMRSDDVKSTVQDRQGRVLLNPEHVDRWQDIQERREELEKWEGLHESWKQRGYSISTLANLWASSYFSKNSTTRPVQVKERDGYEDRRAQMTEKRQESSRRVEPEVEAPVRRRSLG